MQVLIISFILQLFMVGINSVSVFYSGIPLFRNISFVINERDKIGLVGKNGAGKTSLLRLILGLQNPDEGSITRNDDVTLGYLPQEMKPDDSSTPLDKVMTVKREIEDLEKKVHDIENQLINRDDYQSDEYLKLTHDLSEYHDKIHQFNLHEIESQAERLLTGLGFKREEFTRPLSEFSAGWQMRAELARILLLQPSLILLDEPTNHLDIHSIIWLENFLKDYPGAVLTISHDRKFLDRVTHRTIEIVKGQIYDYKASYSHFTELRKERIEQQQRTLKNQQDYIRQQERFIERFRYKNTKAKQVQSKLKQLEKFETVDIDIEDHSTIKFRFPDAKRSGKVVLKADDATKKFGSKKVFENINLEVHRMDRVALVGKNGAGKSTFVKLFCENLDHEGKVELGHNVGLNYYAQIQENTLDPDLTVLQTLEQEAKGDIVNPAKLRGLLGAFLFSGEDTDKKVKVLSGGEKSRLALARMLLRSANLLVLDEPTNHLDIPSKERLKEALIQYNGTLIIVSHDRDFLHGLTNKTIEIDDGQTKTYPGDINEFLNKKEASDFRSFELTEKKSTTIKSKDSAAPSEGKLNYEKKKEASKIVRKLRSDIKKKEQKIEKLEKEIAQLETTMNSESGDYSKDIFFRHAELSQDLERQMATWEELNQKLESNQQILEEFK
ncbi:MAG TPA: glycosyl transferase family 2 [Flavobacteriales bacterium]|jgi:ATP-binding cassette subfamily F protein 3|nr:glycosyl transferase family 2 [Flavobacteriales bacterium]